MKQNITSKEYEFFSLSFFLFNFSFHFFFPCPLYLLFSLSPYLHGSTRQRPYLQQTARLDDVYLLPSFFARKGVPFVHLHPWRPLLGAGLLLHPAMASTPTCPASRHSADAPPHASLSIPHFPMLPLPLSTPASASLAARRPLLTPPGQTSPWLRALPQD